MTVDKKSIRYKLIVPSLIIVVAVFVALLVLIFGISKTVQDDYSRFTISAASNEVKKVLSTAANELTTAHLLGNPVVTEAKQKSVQEALALLWPRIGQDGIIVGPDGAILFSTLGSDQARGLVKGGISGYYSIRLPQGTYHCYAETFPLWDWRVITLHRQTQSLFARSKVGIMLPLVAVGSLLMVLGIFLVLRQVVHRPISRMVSSIDTGETVAPTGLTEFDIIGNAVNDSIRRLREQTAALEAELVERTRMEHALRESDAHIRMLLDNTEEGIFGIDLNGNCTFCNLSCLRMLGYDEEKELYGIHLHDLIHHTHPDGTPYPGHECKVYEAYHLGRKVHIQNEVLWRSDGTSFPVEYWSHPVFENGRISGAVVTFLDISQRKQLEDQLIQAQKMESIGRLAGGVAHDFNNLLTPIIGYTEFLRQDLADNGKSLAMVQQIMKAAQRSKELVQQLLSFSRKQILEMKLIDINQVINSFHGILRRIVRENIDLRLYLTQESYGIRADRNQIEQVIMNLVVNSQDAISEGGAISIETSPVLLDDEYATLHTDVTPGRYLMLAVTDNGSGMDPATRQRIFEPFFTTKGIGKGTGLGLATVYGIVRQHSGNIWVYSEPGKGTTFKIYFPIIDAELPVVQRPLTEITNFTCERCSILVVEDNEMVRTLVHELLERHGFEVLSAGSPHEALQLCKGRDLDLLIADVVMPDMTGPELHAKLLGTYPGLKVLYMSGYTNNVIVHQGVLDEGIHFIQKPFAISSFVQKVQTLLTVSADG